MDRDIPEPKYDGFRVDLAKVTNTPKIKLARGFMLTLDARFGYETGWGNQGIGGYYIDADFIKKFLDVFNAKELKDCKGTLWVEHTNSAVARLIPLGINKKCEEFDVRQWSENLKEEQEAEDRGWEALSDLRDAKENGGIIEGEGDAHYIEGKIEGIEVALMEYYNVDDTEELYAKEPE